MDVASIVIASIALAGSIIAPLVGGIVLLMGRLKRSQCCGSSAELEMGQPGSQPVNPPVILHPIDSHPN
jgi:hypothetical protein